MKRVTICLALLLAFGTNTYILYAENYRQGDVAEATSLQESIYFDESSLILDDPAPIESNSSRGSTTWALVRAILVLAALAFLVWLLLAFIRRRAQLGAARSPHIKVLAQTSLALNRQLFVVSLGTQAWLIATSDAATSVIAEIEDKEFIDTLLLEDSERSALEATRPLSFLSALSTVLGKRASKAPESKALEKMRDRLKDI